MNNLFIYNISILAAYNIAFIVKKEDCISYYSTCPNIFSYIVIILTEIFRESIKKGSIPFESYFKNKVFLYLIFSYFMVQNFWNSIYIIYINVEEKCYTSNSVVFIIYQSLLYLNFIIYLYMKYLLLKEEKFTSKYKQPTTKNLESVDIEIPEI